MTAAIRALLCSPESNRLLASLTKFAGTTSNEERGADANSNFSAFDTMRDKCEIKIDLCFKAKENKVDKLSWAA